MAKLSPVVVVLGNNSISVAKKIISVIPGAKLYGLAGRTYDTDVDVNFTDFGTTLRELFADGTPIIGICATGILIRTLAPLLTNKRQEPPVLAVAEDGSAIVPLLGGLNGVNNLARQIASVFNIQPAITTTGEIRFGIALEDPPPGYHLSNPSNAKVFMSDLLAGNSVRLEGNPLWLNWLKSSSLPINSNAERVIQVTEKNVFSTPTHLIYHPQAIAIGISIHQQRDFSESPIPLIPQILADAELSPASIAGVFASQLDAAQPEIQGIADALNVPVRFLAPDELSKAMSRHHTSDVAVAAALAASQGKLISQRKVLNITCAIAIADLPIDTNTTGRPRGRLAIIGTGPGRSDWMSPEVKNILSNATDFVGYSTYLKLIAASTPGKHLHESDNREEIVRASLALDLAAEGRFVAVVSSGDPGIYAMAAAVFEAWEKEQKPAWQGIDIHVAPGISAMQAAAAQIGAPLGHDFCAVSLSDILKPWSIIEHRILAAAQGDFVIALYNPISKQRTWQLTETKKILLNYRSPNTTVVLARNIGRDGESIKVCTLAELSPECADMRTVIIIGSSKTRVIAKPDGGIWVYTPRRYE
ncbi:precorrin-3B C(17)-methyltransferase [Calothrix sp. UHCC 0171]|uniref:precorrin-3B C(17)-methyltransferase n=1 Tax=Calothrix sp. UHCC 0171 TaxID=3110245 RepID=UPI002B1F25BC|nr:precorrin-3B C(17)-methyltransferase [Calothrix sp. UHCC 0171]MEA5571537.1 precorrin-3B C(17)-methyltransferase [Calothrix sp. UHCC 0171]